MFVFDRTFVCVVAHPKLGDYMASAIKVTPMQPANLCNAHRMLCLFLCICVSCVCSTAHLSPNYNSAERFFLLFFLCFVNFCPILAPLDISRLSKPCILYFHIICIQHSPNHILYPNSENINIGRRQTILPVKITLNMHHFI